MRCPCCGDREAVLRYDVGILHIPQCKPIKYKQKIVVCHKCTTVVDETDDKVREKEILRAKAEAIPKMVKIIEKRDKYNIANLQRAFGLRQSRSFKLVSEEYIHLLFAFLRIIVEYGKGCPSRPSLIYRFDRGYHG